jgi:hypothetical protein
VNAASGSRLTLESWVRGGLRSLSGPVKARALSLWPASISHTGFHKPYRRRQRIKLRLAVGPLIVR